MENSSVASASSEAGSTRSQEIEELERFIDSYVLEYQVQGLLTDKTEAEADGEGDKTQCSVSQWNEDCSDRKDGSWSSSKGKGSSKPNNQDEWEHSSNDSTGSRPSSGSRPGSGSRSGSRGRNNQFRTTGKNGNRENSFDILGTDIWAANTFESHGGATWDLQPEKLDFTQFHRKPIRGTPKHLPHIDREGMVKGKFEEDDGINLSDMEKFLPVLPIAHTVDGDLINSDSKEYIAKDQLQSDHGWSQSQKFQTGIYQPLPNEAEIAQTKKLFRRRRNDRRHVHLSQEKLTVVLPGSGKKPSDRRQQRPPSGNKAQHSQQQQQQHPPPQQPLQQQQQQLQHQDYPQSNTKHNREHSRPYQGQSLHPSGRQGSSHHGYSQNRRWHHNQRHQPAPGGGGSEKDTPNRNTKDTENVRTEEPPSAGLWTKPETELDNSQLEGPAPANSEVKRKDSLTDGHKVNLLQSSKERLRRRLKQKDEVLVETTNPQKNRMDKLIEILNSMRNNSSGVDSKLTTFMEEAQNSTNSEEMLSEIVKTIYQKAATDRSFASTAAKLCDKMALFMVEGTKFRSLLLNMLQRDFTQREGLQQSDVERWLGFITFLCEVFGTMRSSSGEPFRVLVCPIYTCLRELLESQEVKEDAVLCCSMELQSTGKLLEEQLPEMMMELLAAARDKMLCPSESQLTRSLLMEVIELHAHQWNPLEALTTQYYNRTIQKLTT
ncbi:CBP80/20-dependent translation initiation factor-like isoform X2 [Acipenser ruthenus]|nr:CBP80/20-dependent translation initiation factor-like isoform X2 [Acipenser ruthenus]XP_058879756.1 CBP80/20-dependent translation initiation factor-like isoform X2 [Acipenser ruthenus]